MGWVTDIAPGHEGWVSCVVDDGRDTGTSCRDGVVFYPPGGGEEIVPWARVVAWRGRCECGWTGPETPVTTDLKGWRDCPEEIADRTFLPAWEEHVTPATRTYVATWRIEIEASSDEDARRLHREALAAMDEAPCSVFVSGDGPQAGREET